MSDLTFPRQYARTQRFTLGEPRDLKVSPDGKRVVFLRSSAGDDSVNVLWVLDVDSGEEHLVADPATLLSGDGDGDSELPTEEKARRERAREGAGGIVSYATDDAVTVAAFALAGRLFGAALLSGVARELAVEGPVFDPRPDPLGRRIAYVCGSALRIGELDGTSRALAGAGDSNDDSDPNISWGSAEFIAAEEMGRQRGFWWSPDGSAIAVERVDVSPVSVWHITDPAHPDAQPQQHRYPAAGSENADVALHIVPVTGDLPAVTIEWDRATFPYVVAVSWTEPERVLVTVQSRDQRRLRVLAADPSSGHTQTLFEDDDEQWVEIVPGVPRLTGDGRLVMTADRDGGRRLLIDGAVVSPAELQVRSVVDVSGDTVTITANPLDDSTVQHVWQATLGDEPSWADITDGKAGVHAASASGAVVAIKTSTLEAHGSVTTVAGHTITSHAQRPLVEPKVTIHRVTDDEIAVAVLLPAEQTSEPLPVLLDPYGGPHAQRVVSATSAYLTPQWFADQGFCVIVADGRGTPGRGSAWERAVHGDLAKGVLDDQVKALDAITERLAADGVTLDRDRVGIRGWSFGGYLAALAVLSRPDVFHAAVAGAPVTDWRLYDTHYTERYLGDPTTEEGATVYDANSLLPLAGGLERPLLLIHGLADDNVVAAHTLQLSAALLAAGRPHEVLPLSGVTHMTPQEVIAENLLLHQLEFLRRSLRIG